MRMRGDIAYINLGGLLIRFDFDRAPLPPAERWSFTRRAESWGGGGITVWAVWEGLLWLGPRQTTAHGGRKPFHIPAPERHRCTHRKVRTTEKAPDTHPYYTGVCPCGALYLGSRPRDES